MKTLFYLSTASFCHPDMGILRNLAKKFVVTYGVLIPGNGYNAMERELSDYCKANNINFEPFYLTKRLRDVRIGFEFLKVIKTIKKNKPDIIYTFCYDIPIFSMLGLALNKKKTIVFIHDVEFHSSTPFASILKIGRKITIHHFSSFQVFSKNQKILFLKQYPKKYVRDISLPLTDLGHYLNKNGSHMDMKLTRFLFFGKILPYKGLESLIAAINSLDTKYSNFELLIAGRCDNWQTLYEPLIKNKDKVKSIIRHIKNEEIVELFSKCHYLVLPYRDATQSGPLMIAYNYNIPVIASNIPAFKEIVEEGTSGYLFNKENPKALEFALEAAITRKADEYKSLLAKLKQFVSINFSIESIIKEYESMFESIQ